MLTRRFFLKTTGAVAASTCFAPLGLARCVSEEVRREKTLVVIFLRGGMDGLNFIVPHGDADYYDLRGYMAIQRPGADNGAIDLDGYFGLHPWAEPIAPFFHDGSAVAVNAVGYGGNTRSHFEEQDVWETGIVGNTLAADGWLNRHLATTIGHGPVRALSIGDTLPRILRGDVQALALRGLDDLTFKADPKALEAVVASLERAYRPASSKKGGEAEELLRQGGQATLDALRELQAVANKPYETKVTYPDTPIGKRMREAARLIKAKVGVEICELDFGGWDTHQNQGAVGGPYSNLVRQLTTALAAFVTDLDDAMKDVLVLTLSEFGRTAARNGTNGTDHGWANCMLALGGPVAEAPQSAPRKVIGDWPGLGRDELHQQRDLAHTTDFRDVLAEVVRGHLDNPAVRKVIPGREFERVGLV